MRILKTKWFAHFAIKNRIPDQRLKTAIEEVESGIMDADLGGGLIKKRIAREGEGKSGGYRTIIAYRRQATAFFIFGFTKNRRDNIDDKELAILRDAARQYAKLTDSEITAAVLVGQFTEIDLNDKKIQK